MRKINVIDQLPKNKFLNEYFAHPKSGILHLPSGTHKYTSLQTKTKCGKQTSNMYVVSGHDIRHRYLTCENCIKIK